MIIRGVLACLPDSLEKFSSYPKKESIIIILVSHQKITCQKEKTIPGSWLIPGDDIFHVNNFFFKVNFFFKHIDALCVSVVTMDENTSKICY